MKNYYSRLLLFICFVLIQCKPESSPNFTHDKKHIIQVNLKRDNTSACLVGDFLYLLADYNNLLYKIDLRSSKITEVLLDVDLQNSTSIQFNGKYIIISDLLNRSLTFFNDNLQFKKRIILNRFPLDFRIHKHKCILLTDILNTPYYNFAIFEENILNHKERPIFYGDTINANELKYELNLDIPGTLCYDYNGKYLYVAKQRYDSYSIYKFLPRNNETKNNSFINKEWKPIAYNESEYLDSKSQYLRTLSSIKYPSDKIKFSYKLAILAITVDNYNRLWVLSSNSGNSVLVDVYSEKGDKIKTIPIEGIYSAKLIVSENYFVVLEADTPIPNMFVYKIQNI